MLYAACSFFFFVAVIPIAVASAPSAMPAPPVSASVPPVKVELEFIEYVALSQQSNDLIQTAERHTARRKCNHLGIYRLFRPEELDNSVNKTDQSAYAGN